MEATIYLKFILESTYTTNPGNISPPPRFVLSEIEINNSVYTGGNKP